MGWNGMECYGVEMEIEWNGMEVESLPFCSLSLQNGRKVFLNDDGQDPLTCEWIEIVAHLL